MAAKRTESQTKDEGLSGCQHVASQAEPRLHWPYVSIISPFYLLLGHKVAQFSLTNTNETFASHVKGLLFNTSKSYWREVIFGILQFRFRTVCKKENSKKGQPSNMGLFKNKKHIYKAKKCLTQKSELFSSIISGWWSNVSEICLKMWVLFVCCTLSYTSFSAKLVGFCLQCIVVQWIIVQQSKSSRKHFNCKKTKSTNKPFQHIITLLIT